MIPNRKARRKMAKDLGLFKETSSEQKKEQAKRTKEMSKLIKLQNLTKQRNSNK